MKKLDKLLFVGFIPSFLVSYLTACFILVMQFLLIYFDDFVGKGLSFYVFLELFFYFSMSLTPNALPLALLLSSLISFGNLSEHSENIALRTAGVSPMRILRSLFIFVCFLSVGSYFFSDRVVPFFNIKAYSLLYDIRKKKPTFNLISGEFYMGLPGFSIRASEKKADGALKDVIIYDHTSGTGAYDAILAKSCTVEYPTEHCMLMSLTEGAYYTKKDLLGEKNRNALTEVHFDSMQVVFDMSDFSFIRSRRSLSHHRYTVSIRELAKRKNELAWKRYVGQQRVRTERRGSRIRAYGHRDVHFPRPQEPPPVLSRPFTAQEAVPLVSFPPHFLLGGYAATSSGAPVPEKYAPGSAYRALKVESENEQDLSRRKRVDRLVRIVQKTNKKRNAYELEIHRRYALAMACLLMFLIGGSIGTLVKRGGIGMPVLIAFVCYVAFYSLLILGEKNAKEGSITPALGAWMADGLLFLMSVFFLSQALRDRNILNREFIWRLLRGATRRMAYGKVQPGPSA